MSDQTSQSQQPFLRPVKREGSHNNLRNLQNRPEPKSLHEWVAQRVQEINSAFIQPINKEIQKLSYEEAGEWVGKLFSGAGRPFTSISTGRLIEEALDFSNKNSIIRKVTNAAMAPFSYIRDIQQGVQIDQNAKKEGLGTEQTAKKIYADYSKDASLSPQQKQWFDAQLKLEKFNGKFPTAQEWNRHAEEFGMLYTLYAQGIGRT